MSDNVIIALLNTVIPIITAAISAYVAIKLAKMQKQINGRMGELMESTKKLARAEGQAEEKKEQSERDKQ